MTLLILGLILWIAAHFFKRVLPDLRARLGDKGKGLVALILIASLVLMINGFRGAEIVPIWEPPTWTRHLNNLMMLFAVALMGLGHSKGRLRGLMRHPMLIGVKLWAVAHLLVNGDLASIVLFGGLLGWAVVQVIVINRAEPDWTRPEPGPLAGDIKLGVITIVLYGVIAGVHAWLGYPVFGG
ncbi:MAG: NnrU family protein [Rhodobacteraceae bacterium]|nr:NnrU family protein [Paracoccaceae bacterium]